MLSILRFCWRHKLATLISIASLVIITALSVQLWRSRAMADNYQDQLANYDVVTKLHEGAYLQQTQRADLLESLIREYNPQPGTDAAYQAAVEIRYKTRTIKIPVVETRIEYRDKYITINGQQTDPGNIDLSYTLAPLKIALFVTRLKGKYATIIDGHRPDIDIEFKTRLDPDVFQDSKKWFAGAGLLMRLHTAADDYSIYDMGLAVEAGYLFDSWYVKGQAQWLAGIGVGMVFGGRF